MKSMIRFLFPVFFLFSCTHVERKDYVSQSFVAPKEKVWEVVVAIFKRDYPIKAIDAGSKTIETKARTRDQIWKAPYAEKKDLSGLSSTLFVEVIDREHSSKVIVRKKNYQQSGFFSEKKEIPSDLIEESLVLYKIAKELRFRSGLR